ncbi:aromatase/cyclase [Streptomyces sp. enrichment culture]|uniref:aromatase/cyclase n=1 Tax=Streptomyces sp. enrichment culture TaxID=1795815 RepID=UPI003F57F801
MSSTQQHVDRGVVIDADLGTVFDLVADVAGWPQFHRSAVHAEVVHTNEKGELVQYWELAGDSAVRTWKTVRRTDRPGRRITFTHWEAETPATEIRGEWVFAELGPERTQVELHHHVGAPAGADLGPLLDRIGRDSEDHLATLRDTAERRAELDELVVSFTDPLFIAGSVEDAYDYLYRADLWPERIPHVVGLSMTEDVPNVQFFDMDTKGPDGSTHTVRSVRICLPSRLIVYKQISLPAMLDAHTGHWRFTETREGVVAEARHTSTIKRSALSQLGGATTIDEARRYLRRLLSGNSMSNLRLAKAFAEERAGFPTDNS